MIIGFSTGDLLWFDPVSSRYGRLNKQVRLPPLVYNIDYGFAYQTTQGRICNSPCTAVRWVPGSPNLFLVSHMDGTMIIYDKEREDGAFTPHEPTSTSSIGASFSWSSAHSDPSPLESVEKAHRRCTKYSRILVNIFLELRYIVCLFAGR